MTLVQANRWHLPAARLAIAVLRLRETALFEPSVSPSVKCHPCWVAAEQLPARVPFLPTFRVSPSLTVPERDCCLLSFPHPCPRAMFSVSFQSAWFHGHPLPTSHLPGEAGDPSLQSRPPGHPARPSQRLGPRALASGGGRQVGRPVPTFSWALLNFFCICLAKRPAAPPALPSAILLTPWGWPALAPSPAVFWRPLRRKCGFPACLASGPGGRASHFPCPCWPCKAGRVNPVAAAGPPRGRPKAALKPSLAASLGSSSGRPETRRKVH